MTLIDQKQINRNLEEKIAAGAELCAAIAVEAATGMTGREAKRSVLKAIPSAR
jgi:hypothetical protein